jgi:hypothetical protein
MATRDLDRSRSRFITAVTHILDGLKLCQKRLVDERAGAPRLLAGTPYEVVNLTDTPTSDLDYYAYELGRLQNVAYAIWKVFGKPQDLLDAREKFETAIPSRRAARNPLTHPSDNDLLDDVVWLGALVRLKSDGSVEYLIDARYQQHEAAEELAATLLDFLREGLKGP